MTRRQIATPANPLSARCLTCHLLRLPYPLALDDIVLGNVVLIDVIMLTDVDVLIDADVHVDSLVEAKVELSKDADSEVLDVDPAAELNVGVVIEDEGSEDVLPMKLPELHPDSVVAVGTICSSETCVLAVALPVTPFAHAANSGVKYKLTAVFVPIESEKTLIVV